MKHAVVVISALWLVTTVAPANASLLGSATVNESQINGNTFQYDLTLNDPGTTTIGTFWFAWIPGANFMPVSPSNISSPAGWNAIVTHDGSSDGFAVQWTASSPAQDLAAGSSLTGFGFDSTATPAQMAGVASFDPTFPVETSFVYSGTPFSDAGFELVASNANVAVPEPASVGLGAIGAGLLLLLAVRGYAR